MAEFGGGGGFGGVDEVEVFVGQHKLYNNIRTENFARHFLNHITREVYLFVEFQFLHVVGLLRHSEMIYSFSAPLYHNFLINTQIPQETQGFWGFGEIGRAHV